jgi:hypothetical protein
MATFQEVMDEAISDFLKKNNRPVTLKAALKQVRAKRPAGSDAKGNLRNLVGFSHCYYG